MHIGRLLQQAAIRGDVSVPKPRVTRVSKIRGGEFLMLLLLLLALLTIIAFGVGFTVHWLFVVAVLLAVIWLISLLAGGIGGRSRGAWW
jgi:hypothetical protein